jgi:hypothetical protein
VGGLLQRVNWVDILTLILLARITYISSRIGVGKQILPLILLGFILTVSLYNYRIIGWFFIDRYEFGKDLSLFFSYFVVTLIFSIIYHVASRIIGFCFFAGEMVPGGIEKIGGMILGFARANFIIGLILIGLLLTPVRFVDKSVKSSYLGSFYVRTNMKMYTLLANSFLKQKVVYKEEAKELFSKKERYLFDTER